MVNRPDLNNYNVIMCGRFAQSSSEQYAELFGVSTDLSIEPRYNVAPSSAIIACRLNDQGEKELTTLRWGLIPSWSKDPDNRYRMINARAETVAEKPAYRRPFRNQRCLIPAAGFYEWQQQDGKQPYYIHSRDDTPLVFAGIWDHCQDANGDRIDSCAIIVCAANAQMRGIHERMPVMLASKDWSDWLHEKDVNIARQLLVPYHDDLITYPVSKAVNSPKNDSEELISRIS